MCHDKGLNVTGTDSLAIFSDSGWIYVVQKRPSFQLAAMNAFCRRDLSSIQHVLMGAREAFSVALGSILMQPVLFAVLVSRLWVLDVTVKEISLRLIVGYAPNYHSERLVLFCFLVDRPVSDISSRGFSRRLRFQNWPRYGIYRKKDLVLTTWIWSDFVIYLKVRSFR